MRTITEPGSARDKENYMTSIERRTSARYAVAAAALSLLLFPLLTLSVGPDITPIDTHPSLTDLFPADEMGENTEGGPEYADPVGVDEGFGRQRISGVPGETIDPRTGALEFQVADLTVPGNGGLDLVVSRTRRASFFAHQGATYVTDGSFQDSIADWMLDIPHVELRSVNEYRQHHVDLPYTPLVTNLEHLGGLHQGVCQSPYPPHPSYRGETTGLPNPSPSFLQYFGGVKLAGIPGQPTRELLLRNAQQRLYVNSRYATPDHWVVRCEGSRHAPHPVSKFVVRSPEGTIYTFDEPTKGNNLALSGKHPYFGRMRVFVSRIEDRNGNWIEYEYDDSMFSSNVLQYPALGGRSTPDMREFAYVKRIHASDGREVTFEWEANPFVPAGQSACRGNEFGSCGSPALRLKRFSHAGRAWQFRYNDQVDRGSIEKSRYLESVELPNGQRYRYTVTPGSVDLSGQGCLGFPYSAQPSDYRVVFPDGGVAAYTMTTRRFERRGPGGGSCWYWTAVGTRKVDNLVTEPATTRWCPGPTNRNDNSLWMHVLSPTRHDIYNFEREGSDGRWWGEGQLASHQIRAPLPTATCPANLGDPGAGYLRKTSYSYVRGSAIAESDMYTPGYPGAIVAPRVTASTVIDEPNAGRFETTTDQRDAFMLPQLTRESLVNQPSTASTARRTKVKYDHRAIWLEIIINRNLARAYWFSSDHEQVEFWASRNGGPEFLVHRGGPPTSGPVLLNEGNFTPGDNTIFSISVYPANQHLPERKLAEIRDMPVVGTELKTYRTENWQVGRPGESCLTASDSAACAVKDGVAQSERSIYDARGNLITKISFGSISGYTYWDTGDVQSTIDPLQRATIFTSYKRGKARTITPPGSGGSETLEVDDHGQTTRITNANKVDTRYDYDSRGRLKTVDYVSGADAALVWSVDGRERTVTRGRLNTVTRFDGFGRLVHESATDTSIGETTSRDYTFDAAGNRVFESDPYSGGSVGSGAQTEYDALDRAVLTRRIVDGATSSVTFETPEKQLRRDFSGSLSTYAFRSYGSPSYEQLVRADAAYTAIDANGAQATRTWTTQFDPDAQGFVRSIQQGNVMRRYGINARREPVGEFSPEIGGTLTSDGYNISLCRDDAGHITGKSIGAKCVDPASANLVANTYDERGRLKTIDYRDSASADVSITYDGMNRILLIDKGGTSSSFTYDKMNNLCSQIRRIDTYAFALRHEYDDLQHATSLVYPSGKRYSLSSDAFGKLRSIAGMATIDYYPTDLPESIIFANGQVTTFQLTADSEVHKVTTQRGVDRIVDLTYGYDADRNVTSVADELTPSATLTLGYDELNRLTETRLGKVKGAVYRRGYDDSGNVAFDQTPEYPLINYTYAVNNRLTSTSGSLSRTLGYDALGNVASDGTKTMQFGYDGNLMHAATTDKTKSMTYDGRDRLLREDTDEGPVYYVYSGDNLMFEYRPDKRSYIEYLYAGAMLIGSRTVENADLADADGDGVSDVNEFRGLGQVERCPMLGRQ